MFLDKLPQDRAKLMVVAEDVLKELFFPGIGRSETSQSLCQGGSDIPNLSQDARIFFVQQLEEKVVEMKGHVDRIVILPIPLDILVDLLENKEQQSDNEDRDA
ncbi:hypothetical protein [Solidesulfovibrio carbinoliphilus]|uniref:hypothetical protein n=1 Tax=Solidesulfovibrio carbinoliphilus TaxID=345370 RepID=UPI001E3BA262|nr:hypothetical protein [Solidesulfovibrio carbinoliphilus]